MAKTITLDEARKCPECGNTGTTALTRPIQDGTLHTIRCATQLCSWYDTDWLVETDQDGKVMVNEKAMEIALSQRNIIVKGNPEFDRMHEMVHAQLSQQNREETGR